MTTDTIKHLGAEFHHAAEGVGEALLLLEHARADRLAFLRQCSKDSTARLAALKEEVRALPEQIAKCDAEAARLESQTAEDLLRQALETKGGDANATRDARGVRDGESTSSHARSGISPDGLQVTPPSVGQAEGEPFRAGLPPERLRKVWAEWEDDEGDVVTFKDEHYHWSNWRASMPVKRIHDFAWSGLRLKPLGTSWSRVEAMADATEKPKCPACGKKPDRDTRPLSAGEYVTCQSCGLYLRVIDGAWQIVRPVENCGHVAADGTCAHPNAQTPECHDGVVCPAKAEKLAEPKMLDLRELPPGTVCEALEDIPRWNGRTVAAGVRFTLRDTTTTEGDEFPMVVTTNGENSYCIPYVVPARVVEKGGEDAQG